MDLNTIKFGSLVGLGEASHGTCEYQRARLEIIKYLNSKGPIQVFIEARFVPIELLKKPGLSKTEFIEKIKNVPLFSFMKSKFFCKILWYLYKNHIPFFGVDTQINDLDTLHHPILEWINEYNKNNSNRSDGMIKLISLIWDKSTRGVFIAHNYHVSKYVGFPGTSIGFATLKGTVRHYDNIKNKFIITKLKYEDQELNYNKPKILKTKKWFYSSGESNDSDMQQLEGNNFDYVIYIPKTTAIPIDIF